MVTPIIKNSPHVQTCHAIDKWCTNDQSGVVKYSSHWRFTFSFTSIPCLIPDSRILVSLFSTLLSANSIPLNKANYISRCHPPPYEYYGLTRGTLPHQVRPSDHRSDLDSRCVGSLYEKEGCEQHEYSLWRHRFTDCSVEVTLRSDCLGCLNWPRRRGALNS